MSWDKGNIKYLIVGTGATGGAIGGMLANAGRDVTFIARGSHLETMRSDGLRLHHLDQDHVIGHISAFTAEEYRTLVTSGEVVKPDVIFVCVKGYSVDGIMPLLKDAAGQDTIVIPILNIFGTGSRIQKDLPDTMVLDGCIYIWSELKEPGYIYISGDIFKVVFGLRRDQKDLSERLQFRLERIKYDLDACGIEAVLSDNIERDALMKFSYVSPQGACGLYFETNNGGLQSRAEIRDCFIRLVREISALADAMELGFGEDIVPSHLRIIDVSSPDAITSMQRDIAAGRRSEIDGLIYEVVRLGRKYGVNTPEYCKIAEEMRSRGLGQQQ